MICECHRDPEKRSEPFTPDEFLRSDDEPKRPPPPTAADREALRRRFPGKKA